jgi:HSP20 family molecular chaperone IbpA
MSLIPHSFFPRSAFDMDQWLKPMSTHLGPNTMDLFDPYDELDHMIGRNLEWLNKPDFLQTSPLMPKVPQKYRITIDCAGFTPKSIKTDVKGHTLTVTGREEDRQAAGDFSVKEFKKTYTLPTHSEPGKLVSFMTSPGHLIIEVPLRETTKHLNEDLFPRIVDLPGGGGKEVSMKFQVPETIDPSKVHVSIKDRDLIVKAEDKVDKPDGISRFYYYKRTTLPENTDFSHLKCSLDNHQIQVRAPLDRHFNKFRHIPLEHTKQSTIEPNK